MYKHAISWRASFVERSRGERYASRSVLQARAIAEKFGLGTVSGSNKTSRASRHSSPNAALRSSKLSAQGQRTNVNAIPTVKKRVERSRSTRASVPVCVDGKLQSELRKYLSSLSDIRVPRESVRI